MVCGDGMKENKIKTTQRNFRFPNHVYSELQATATTSNCSITDLIVAGARKEIIWCGIKNSIGVPETLVPFDKEGRVYQAEPEWRKQFLAELEKRIPIQPPM